MPRPTIEEQEWKKLGEAREQRERKRIVTTYKVEVRSGREIEDGLKPGLFMGAEAASPGFPESGEYVVK